MPEEVDLMAELDDTECRCEDHEPDPETVHRCPMHASWEIHRLGEVVTQVTAQRDAAREETRTWRTMHRAAVAAREEAEARRRVALAEDAADRLTAAGRGEIERLTVERDRALALRDDALAGQGAALHALSRVVDERRAAREEAEQLRAERDRAVTLLDDEGTARVVAAAERLRALETARDHAIAAELRQWAKAMRPPADWSDLDEAAEVYRAQHYWAGRLLHRVAELEAAESAPAEPHREAWRVTVDVPLDAPHRDGLFAAVSGAVSDWEPEQRDGWDACVTAHPVATDPAEVVADLGLTGTCDAPGPDPTPITRTGRVHWAPSVVRDAAEQLGQLVTALSDAEQAAVEAQAIGSPDGGIRIAGVHLTWLHLACLLDIVRTVVGEPAREGAECDSCGLELSATDEHTLIAGRLRCVQIQCWLDASRAYSEHCTECRGRLPDHTADCPALVEAVAAHG